MANNRIKADAGKLAEALRGKVFGRRQVTLGVSLTLDMMILYAVLFNT
jgi:hypothetical protein